MPVEKVHEERETLSVDVNIPGHAPRTETSLFERTRKVLIEREGGRCWVCGRTETEAGPLQVHHYPVERSLANGIDFSLVERDCKAGMYGPYAKAFDWDKFRASGDVYSFVDDATVNGIVLCRDHHIGKDAGIHWLPHPLWIAQRYMKAGYQYTPEEKICHEGVE